MRSTQGSRSGKLFGMGGRGTSPCQMARWRMLRAEGFVTPGGFIPGNGPAPLGEARAPKALLALTLTLLRCHHSTFGYHAC